MQALTCALVGAPIQSGASQAGCLMGPDGFRTAGLQQALESLGHRVTDFGNAAPTDLGQLSHPNTAIHNLSEIVGWAQALQDCAYQAASQSDMPIFLGGDHSLSIGTVPGVARHAAEQNRPQFVLWLDAHPDIHTLDTTTSGNLHGTPVAYFTGLPGFEGVYPPLAHPVPPQNICMMGIRSVDPAENRFLSDSGMTVHDMRAIDERGIVAPLT